MLVSIVGAKVVGAVVGTVVATVVLAVVGAVVAGVGFDAEHPHAARQKVRARIILAMISRFIMKPP
jgi:hypothetical protein